MSSKKPTQKDAEAFIQAAPDEREKILAKMNMADFADLLHLVAEAAAAEKQVWAVERASLHDTAQAERSQMQQAYEDELTRVVERAGEVEDELQRALQKNEKLEAALQAAFEARNKYAELVDATTTALQADGHMVCAIYDVNSV